MSVNKREDYRGCVIMWQEPPATAAGWTVNVASDDRGLAARIGPGAKAINDPHSLEGAIAQAKRFIDNL